MKRYIQLIARVIMVIVALTTVSQPVTAAGKAKTLKEIINEVKLEPIQTEYWSESYYNRIGKIAKDGMTNYDKMRAVYNDVVKNYDKTSNCVGYAAALQCAFEVVGFRTYHMRGETTLASGGWTVHSWVGVDIGGRLYYFDANLPGRYNAPDKYFAVPAASAKFYRKVYIEKIQLNPDSDMYALLNSSDGIPEKPSQRQKYLSEAGERAIF